MMKKNKSSEWEDFDENNSFSFSQKNLLIGGGIIVSIAWGMFEIFSKNYTLNDAKIEYIKHDYDKSLSIVNEILLNDELSYEFTNALEVKANILLNKDSDLYDPNEALNVLKEAYNNQKSFYLAQKIIKLSNDLKKPTNTILNYLKFLSEKGEIDSTSALIKYYLSSKDEKMKLNAIKYLALIPDSSDKFIKLATLEMIAGSNNVSITRAEKYLDSAIVFGSAIALSELAFLKLKKASRNPRQAQSYRNEFPLLIKRSIDLGYTGSKLIEAEVILRYGRFGVPQDINLANQLNKILRNDKKNNN